MANLDFPFTGFHIHQAPATTTGSIVVDFGSPETFRTGNSVVGQINNLSSTTLGSIIAAPSGFYFNMHNTTFGGGAVRDQLGTLAPEPASLSLVCLSMLTLRRKR